MWLVILSGLNSYGYVVHSFDLTVVQPKKKVMHNNPAFSFLDYYIFNIVTKGAHYICNGKSNKYKRKINYHTKSRIFEDIVLNGWH